jgi:hypothetical protein
MKLTDLKPRWIGLSNWESEDDFYIGVSFQSPMKTGQRLAVLFDPPIDPAGLAEKYGWGKMFPDAKHWQRTGDTFENLTLSPSLDFSARGEWHGLITNGEAV